MLAALIAYAAAGLLGVLDVLTFENAVLATAVDTLLLAWGAAGLAPEAFQPEWIWAVFLVWYTLVFGHVLRHALSITLAAGVAASLLYLFFSIGVTGLFMTPLPATN